MVMDIALTTASALAFNVNNIRDGDGSCALYFK